MAKPFNPLVQISAQQRIDGQMTHAKFTNRTEFQQLFDGGKLALVHQGW